MDHKLVRVLGSLVTRLQANGDVIDGLVHGVQDPAVLAATNALQAKLQAAQAAAEVAESAARSHGESKPK